MTDQLTLDKLRHLELATAVKVARAADKRRVKNGALDVATILRDPPSHWINARILELLLAMPRVGRVKANRWLAIHKVSADRRLATIPPNQRHRLAAHIDAYALRRDRLRRQLEGRAA